MHRALGVVGLLSAMLVGCQAGQSFLVRENDKPSPHEETIKITIASGSSVPGGYSTFSTWEFQPTGDCCQSHSTHYNDAYPAPTEKKSKWQSRAAYEKCAVLLRQTRFFHMKDKIPDGWFGGTVTSISVRMGRRTNEVSYLGFGERPQGISRIIAFLDECTKEPTAIPIFADLGVPPITK